MIDKKSSLTSKIQDTVLKCSRVLYSCLYYFLKSIVMRLIKISHCEIIFIFFGCLFLFLFDFNHSEIIDFDSRFYLFALEMWRHGVHWFPTTYQQPYPDYPVTSTLLVYIAAIICRGLNKFSAVLPSAIAAALTVVVTYQIGALHDRYWGRCGAVFLLLTLAFFQNARSIALDIYSTLITATCFYLINKSLNHTLRQTRMQYIALLCLFALGFAFRGPIGLVIPTGVVCICYLADMQQAKRFKQYDLRQLRKNLTAIFLVGTLSLLVLIFLMLLLLAIARYFYDVDFMHAVLRMQVLGRINARPIPHYFYWVQGVSNYAFSFPIAFLVMGGVVYFLCTKKISMSPQVNMLFKLTAWVLIIMLGMSIPDEKKTRYILPIAPATALIAAYVFVVSSQEKYWIILRWFIIKLFLFFPILLMLMMSVFIFYERHAHLEIILPYAYLFLACGLMQIFYLLCMQKKQLSTALMVATVILFSGFYIFMVEPIQLFFNRTRDFVVQVEAERLASHAKLVFFKEGPDGLPIKYLINMPQEEQPLFVEHVSQLATMSYPLLIITSMTHFKQFTPAELKHFMFIRQGKIGHTEVVVFRPVPAAFRF